MSILDDLVATKKFELPVAVGRIDWANFGPDVLKPGSTKHDLQVAAHTVAFGHCCMGVEKFMRLTWPFDEDWFRFRKIKDTRSFRHKE